MSATTSWLGGGGFYLPHQLAGPYTVAFGDVLYPPLALWLFIPFTALPAVLWWVVPLGTTVWAVWRHRPRHVVWPFMALILAWQPAEIHLVSGNPDIWALAWLALATHYRWPGALILFKPSIGWYALWGIHDRLWWIALACLAILSVVLLPMWSDWFTAIGNMRGGAGLLYSWQESVLLLLPVVSWAGRTSHESSSRPPPWTAFRRRPVSPGREARDS